MEAAEDSSIANGSLKRQRAPLVDPGDNLLLLSEVNDGQKHPRLESSGQENCTPVASSSGRGAELMIKPDTPIVPSVRTRVQQLAQKGDVAQYGLPDGSTSLSSKYHQHLLSEADFHQRMVCFKGPLFQAGPDTTHSPAKPRPRNLSSVVSGIQHKLQGDATPSSKQASRIRQNRCVLCVTGQEREQELNQLHLQPIRENAWLKRSSSDPSLSQVDAEMKDGTITSGAHSSSLTVCWTAACSSAGLSAPNEGRLPTELKEQTTGQVDLGRRKRLVDNQPCSTRAKRQTVLQLSFSEDGVFSKEAGVEDHNVLESTRDESNADNGNVSKVTEWSGSAEEDDKEGVSSYVEESMELSTEEKLRLWRYPTCRGGDSTEESDNRRCDASRENSDLQHSDCSHIQDAAHLMLHVNGGTFGSPHTHHGRTPREEQIHCHPRSSLEDQRSDKHLLFVSGSDEGQKQSRIKYGAATVTSNIYDNKIQVDTETEEENQQDMDQVSEKGSGAVVKVQNSNCAGSGTKMVEDSSKCTVGGAHSKKVTFILEPELMNSSMESGSSDVDLSSHDDTNTAEVIDQMFEEVLDYAERIEEQQSSNVGTEKHDAHVESERGKEEDQIYVKKEECQDELFLPTTSILSPLSKSIEAVVTPLKQRLEVSKEANPLSLLQTADETASPLYSVDAYRTQRQSKVPTMIQSVTPSMQRRAPEKPQPRSSNNTREKIATLNEEAAKLQMVINQTLQALSCCTDEEHGRGSLEEAEAEKLLLVSCEKRSACLAEVAMLREERSSDSSGEEYVTQQPCKGTVTVRNIQLPLKVEFVCSSYNRSGQPSHYFFILIRYGASKIVATPLATAVDAQNGDTISFPTSVTLKDIRSTFHIDVEVYSLSHTTNTGMDRTTTRSRVTPRKLLSTITKTSSSLTSAAIPAFNTHRSSNFSLVGSHKITLASLGHSKFPLDKMTLDSKIRKLLGDEFQEKVPFMSPLEGSIYLQLDSQSHSCVQHQGFLTIFELISGFGLWHRRYFTLDGCTMHYWNHPNDKESKEAEGIITLSSSPNQCVRPVKRDSCARPFTFELVSSLPQDNQESLTKCWFSADTKQERLDWMEKLNQALFDFHTWKPTPSIPIHHPSNTSRENLRESIL
ncbi:anillin isoform X2 [Dunckerocampus dactyliophorus]|uniref:anillin isoform X2 n=1 Tax=Dunckerocampus dactyliophorus TaxID=161453 RepID=UPI0024057D32|nr:anillin isoform X2 [Dunckerocampus dactyliophorus]